MNRVVLIGRVTKDIECRYTTSQKAVAKFTLAVNRKEGADFISCTAWNKTAEIMEKYVKKGHRIGLTGRIQTGSYDKDGSTVYTTEVVVDEVEFLESKTSSGNDENHGYEPHYDPIDDDIPF